MINLIPLSAQAIVRREYLARVATVWLVLLGTALLILVVLMLPVYVLVSIKANQHTDIATVAEVRQSEQAQLRATLAAANQQAMLISQSRSSGVSLHELITFVKGVAAGVALTEYRLTTGDTPTLTLGGEATTRLALATFRDTIASHPQFVEVNLPISMLARDREIPFTLTVTLATTTTP